MTADKGSQAPAFSILMAAWNTERFIEEAIRSVLAQTRADWELIVVDDGSPDALASRVEPFLADPRIQLLRQSNRGIDAARNVAAAAARGRYLTLLDSDDALLPDYLEAVGEVLEAHPNAALVSCDAFVFMEESQRLRRRTYLRGPRVDPPRRHDPSHHLERLLHHNFLYPGSTFRRDVFDLVGGFGRAERQGVDDWRLWIRIAASGAVTRVIDRPLAVYRYRSESLSRDGDGMDHAREEMLVATLRELDLPRAARRAALGSLARCRRRGRLGAARNALLAGDGGQATRLAQAAFRAQPTLKGALIIAGVALAPSALQMTHRRKQAVKSVLGVAKARIGSRPAQPDLGRA